MLVSGSSMLLPDIISIGNLPADTYFTIKYPIGMKYLIVLISFVFAFSSCSHDDRGWKTHQITEGNFSIEMPAPIEKVDKKEVTVFGKQTRHFVHWKPSSFAIDKFKLFEVSYVDCPTSVITNPDRLNRVLDSAVDMRMKDFSEVDIIESQPIEFNGYPGRAFFYDAPKGNTSVSVKICVADGKLFDLVVVAKKNYAVNEDMSRFFDSFRLLH